MSVGLATAVAGSLARRRSAERRGELRAFLERAGSLPASRLGLADLERIAALGEACGDPGRVDEALGLPKALATVGERLATAQGALDAEPTEAVLAGRLADVDDRIRTVLGPLLDEKRELLAASARRAEAEGRVRSLGRQATELAGRLDSIVEELLAPRAVRPGGLTMASLEVER